jgi:hypothetical protein
MIRRMAAKNAKGANKIRDVGAGLKPALRVSFSKKFSATLAFSVVKPERSVTWQE